MSAASVPDPDRGVLFPRAGVLFPDAGGWGVPPGRPPGGVVPPRPRRPAEGATRHPRWAVAHRVSEALCQRYGGYLQAIGVYGAAAHGDDPVDDSDISDVELVVVTRRDTVGPAPVTRRVEGVIIDLAVIPAEEYLSHARTITTSWPMVADQYLTAKALYDPEGFLARLRDVHLTRLAQADGQLFAALAREAWCQATIAHGRARRMAELYETDVAGMTLAEARLAVAIVEGLLTRTYFRNSADAVRRANVASASVSDLGQRLAVQARELARRGRPVDGGIDDLLD